MMNLIVLKSGRTLNLHRMWQMSIHRLWLFVLRLYLLVTELLYMYIGYPRGQTWYWPWYFYITLIYESYSFLMWNVWKTHHLCGKLTICVGKLTICEENSPSVWKTHHMCGKLTIWVENSPYVWANELTYQRLGYLSLFGVRWISYFIRNPPAPSFPNDTAT